MTKMRKVCAKKDRREGMSGLRNVGVEWARREKEKVGQENQERRASEVERTRETQENREGV